MIQHIKPEVETTYDDIGRLYKIDRNYYYSVTSVLSATSDKSSIDVWRERIGENEADKITKNACNTGEGFHQKCENYLLNEPSPKKSFLVEKLFKECKPILDKYIDYTFATEIVLWSHVARIAGRADAVVSWRGEPVVLDYKCINNNDPRFLGDYWIQLTMYAMCIREMFGVNIKKLILVTASKRNLSCTSFESPTRFHLDETIKRIKKFREIMKDARA
jgi:genome maintenance exonuclease 1